MDGEKYLSKRMSLMKKSRAGMFAGIKLRILILLVVIGVGWLSCDQGLKYFQTQSYFYSR
jgi:hypothetical protein